MSSGTDYIPLLLLKPLFMGLERTSSALHFWLILILKRGSAAVPLAEQNEAENFFQLTTVLFCQEACIIIRECFWCISRIQFMDELLV